MATSSSRRFDLVELSLVVLLVAVAGWIAGRTRSVPPVPPADTAVDVPSEARALADKYGPARNSEHEEEWVIRDFFGTRRDGVFLDVGANDYKTFSNTYYLETALGWSGIAVEPQRQFAAGYAEFRPRTKFLPFFVSDASNQRAKLYVLSRNPLVTSADKSFTSRYGKDTTELEAPTITLDDLLAAEAVKALDFVSMDIELWEPKALAGFDLERFHPALVCIEAQPEVRQQIIDYFVTRHYTIAA